MARVKVLVVETAGVDEPDQREGTNSDSLECNGLTNTAGDLTFTTSTQNKTLNTIVSEILTLDSNKDNGVAGFVRSTMNNLSLYNAIANAGILGPVTYPLPMSYIGANTDMYLQWGTGLDSYTFPWQIPFASRSLAITASVELSSRFTISIYKNSVWATPILTLDTSTAVTSYSANISLGQPGYFTLAANDKLTYRITKVSGSNPKNATMVLWLQNI